MTNNRDTETEIKSEWHEAELPAGYRDKFTARELEVFQLYDDIERRMSPIAEVAIGNRQVTIALVTVNGKAFARISDDDGRTALIPVAQCWRYRDRWRRLTACDIELLNGTVSDEELEEIRCPLANLEAHAETWFGEIWPT